MATTALVLLAIGDRMSSYRRLTEPHWKTIAERLSADLIVLTERLDPTRKLAAWQKLLLPRHLGDQYQQIIYADVDILPHPSAPLADLMAVPEGKIGLCRAPSPEEPKKYYKKALGLQPSDVTNVQHILNAGIIVWKTRGSDAIKQLFADLYSSARQHCAEQSSLSWAAQQQGMHHLLPSIYNTNFIKTKPFPFNSFALHKRLQRVKPLKPLASWSNRRTLRRLLASPCFIHFVGGIFEDALRDGATLLEEQLTQLESTPATASNQATSGFEGTTLEEGKA